MLLKLLIVEFDLIEGVFIVEGLVLSLVLKWRLDLLSYFFGSSSFVDICFNESR